MKRRIRFYTEGVTLAVVWWLQWNLIDRWKK